MSGGENEVDAHTDRRLDPAKLVELSAISGGDRAHGSRLSLDESHDAPH